MGVLLHTAPLWSSPKHTLRPPSCCSPREAGLCREGEGAETAAGEEGTMAGLRVLGSRLGMGLG